MAIRDTVAHRIFGMASIGAAAISIEDQVFPKRCTYVAGSSVNALSRNDAVKRIKTALQARDEAWEKDGNKILLIARTDCRLGSGFEEAQHRCQLFEEMGGDIVYAEALQSREEYEMLRKSLDVDTITMLAQVQTDASKQLFSTKDVRAMGFDITLLGVSALQAAVQAITEASKLMLDDNESADVTLDNSKIATFERVREVVGFPELEDFESDYGCTPEVLIDHTSRELTFSYSPVPRLQCTIRDPNRV